ncbi:MAG TPA: proton-conducting transporter membrane subunit [Aggregatilineales bacterium]|nr:proton-conducting transporter membrane subunit [Aggregatilineales bacterium]
MAANNLLLIVTVFVPLIGAVVSLFFWGRDRIQRRIGFAAGVIAWLASIGVLAAAMQDGPQVYRLGGWDAPFGIVLVGDALSSIMVLMSSTVLMAGLLYALGCHDKVVKNPAFTALFLGMETGLLGALFTGDLFTMFVFMEIMVLSSVSLVAISDNKLGLEAAIKYLFISSMGTLFLLLGTAAVYATFGTLNFADIGNQLAQGDRSILAREAAVMLTAAFLLKSAVFPFHFWQPDFHTTAPTPVHAVLSSVVVKIGVYGLIRMTTLLFTAEGELEAIRTVLLVLGTISIFFGSLGAFRTYDGKRMLAYSTFGQIGFILLGIGWGTPLALAAAIVYAFNHAFIKSALLMLFGVVSSRTQTKSARLTEVAGVGRSLPLFVGLLYLLGGMALAGIPPLNGFISKLALVQSGIDAQMWLTLGLAIGAGILTLMYMTRTWQLVFQQKPDASTAPLKTYNDSPLAPALLIAGCVALGLFAAPLAELATAAADQILNAPVYIEAVLGVEPAAIVGR